MGKKKSPGPPADGLKKKIMYEEQFRKLNCLDENWVYRYREYSSLSIKELLYEEMYFSSKEELNDPLDLICDLRIKKGQGFILKYFIDSAFNFIKIINKDFPSYDAFVDDIIKLLLQSDIFIEEIFIEPNGNIIKAIYENHELPYYDTFIKIFKNILFNLKPLDLRSVSFSTNPNNPLLWSTYANRHKGFCLIFNPKESNIRLRNHHKKEYENYKLYEINYDGNKIIDLDIFFDDNEEFNMGNVYENYFIEIKQKALLTKNNVWLKEDEKRIFGSYGITFSHVEGKPKDETIIDRIYHFDPEQLIGVVLGIGLTDKEERNIIKIIENKRGKYRVYKAIPAGNDIEIVLKNTFSYQKKRRNTRP